MSDDFTIESIDGENVLTKYTGVDSDIVIPQGVTKIGNEAFSGCTSLTSVVIPTKVTEIRGGTFSGCTSLTSVVIPQGVTQIGEQTFTFCKSLTSIFIPETVKNIGDYAFRGCTNLVISAPKDSYVIEYAKNEHIPNEEL